MLGNLYWFEILTIVITLLGIIIASIILLKTDCYVAFAGTLGVVIAVSFALLMTSFSIGTKEYNLYVTKDTPLENGALVRTEDNRRNKTIEFITTDKKEETFTRKNIDFNGDIKYIKSNENRIEYDVYKQPFISIEKARNIKVYYNASDFK